MRLIWRYADVVEGGWVEPSDVYRPLPVRSQFLIVTEGNTDASILRKAFEVRRPRIADFFYFVDMKENYPSTGTGNLFNFSKDLARIRVENQVLVLYDNDAEGQAKARATTELVLPRNIRALSLPSLTEFEDFPTIGPTGAVRTNINRAAASIECYLDLDWSARSPPTVRWTSYQSDTGVYQGALTNKDQYTRAFLSLREHEYQAYNFRKLDAVLDELVVAAVAMASERNPFDAP